MTRTLFALAALMVLSSSPAFANYGWEMGSTPAQLVAPSTSPLAPYAQDEKGYGDLITSRTEEQPTARIEAVGVAESSKAEASQPGGFHNR